MVLRLLAVLGEEVQLATLPAGHLVSLVLQLVLSVQASLNTPGQVNLLLGVEQRNLANLLQVILHRIGGRAGDRHLLDRFVGLIRVGDDETTLHVNTRVCAFTQRRPFGNLGVFFLCFFLSLYHLLVVAAGAKIRILQVFADGFEFLLGCLEIRRNLLDNLDVLLLASARLLGCSFPVGLLLGGAARLLRTLARHSLLRGSLLRSGLLRSGLLGGRRLVLGTRGSPTLRRRSLGDTRRLLRGGLHLRGLLAGRRVLCRSARCTHTGPFR